MAPFSGGSPPGYPHIERIVILIDGNNLFQGARQFKDGFKIDYGKLIRLLTGQHKLVRAYFFDCIPEQNQQGHEQKKKFVDMLRTHGITIVSRKLRYKPDGTPYQKGVDVALATEMLALCMQNAYDKAIIVSGDSDYAHAIEKVKHTGKNVHCASFRSSLSQELKDTADQIILLDNLAEEFALE